MIMEPIIRASRHSTKYMNSGKKQKYLSLLNDCKIYKDYILDELWNNPVDILTENNNHYYFNIKRNHLDIPTQCPCSQFKTDKFCTRLVSAMTTQVMGEIQAKTKPRKKQLFVLKNLQQNHKPCRKLQSKIDRHPLIKPTIKSNSLELSSKNAVIVTDDEDGYYNTSEFDCFVKLQCLGDSYGHIIIPIKFTAMDKKFIELGGKLLGSFLFSEDFIDFRYEFEIPKKEEGIVVGCDPGYNVLLTFSDGQTTKLCIKNVIEKKCIKRKGSGAYKRAQIEQQNLIDKAVKDIDLSNIREIRYEMLCFSGVSHNKKIAKWTYGYLKDVMKEKCEMTGVLFVLQDSPYMSQRCSKCGWVCSSNRKGSIFLCKHCHHADNADFNAATNHGQGQLFDLRNWFWTIKENKLSKTGFFWNSSGIYDISGNCLMEIIRSLASRKAQ